MEAYAKAPYEAELDTFLAREKMFFSAEVAALQTTGNKDEKFVKWWNEAKEDIWKKFRKTPAFTEASFASVLQGIVMSNTVGFHASVARRVGCGYWLKSSNHNERQKVRQFTF